MKAGLEQTRGMGSPRNQGKASWSYHATDFGTEFLGGFTYFKTALAPGVGEVEVWRNEKMEVLLKKKLTKPAHAQTELVQSKIRALRAKGFQRLIAISQEPSGDAYFLEFSKKNLEDHLKICQERDQSVAEEDLLDLFRVLVDCGANMEETGDYHPSLTLKNIFRIKEAFKVLNPYVFDSYIDEALRIHLPASMPTKPDGLTKAEKLEINVTQVAVIILSMGLLVPEEQLKKLVKTESGRHKLLKDLAEKYSPNLSTKAKLILEGKLTSFSELRSLIEVGKFSSLGQNPQGQSSWDISPPIDLERERIIGLGHSGQSGPVVAKSFSSTAPVSKHQASSAHNPGSRLKEDELIHQLPKPKAAPRADITPQKPMSSTQQGFKRDLTDTRPAVAQSHGFQSMTPPNLAHRSTGALEKVAQQSQEKQDKFDRQPRTETTLDDGSRPGDRYPTRHPEVLAKQANDRNRKDSLEDEPGRGGLALKEVPIKKGVPAHLERVSLNRNLADELTFSNIYSSEVIPRYSRTPVSSATPTRAVAQPVEEDKAKSAQEFYRPSSKSRDLMPRDLQGNSLTVGGGEDKVSAIFNKLQNRFQRYTSGTLDEDLLLKNKEVPDDHKAIDRRWTHNPTSMRQNPLSLSSYDAVPQVKPKQGDPSQLLKQELSSVMDRKPNGALRRTVAEDTRFGLELPPPRHSKLEGGVPQADSSGYMWGSSSFAQPRHLEASKDRYQGNLGHKSQLLSDPDEYRIGQYQSVKLAPRHQLSASKTAVDDAPMGMSLRNFRDSRDPEQGSSSKKQQKFEREQEYASLYLTHLKQNEPAPTRPDQDLSVEYSTGKKNRSVSFNLGHASHNSSHLGGATRGRSVVKGILKKGSEEREYWSTRQDVYLHKPQPNLATFKLYTSEDRYTGELASDRGFKIEPTPMKATSHQDTRWRPTVSLHEDRIDDKIRKLKNQEFEENSNYRWRRGLEISAPPGHSSFGSRMSKTPVYFR